MAQFKVNDLVIAKADSPYPEMREGFIGRVLSLDSDERFTIEHPLGGLTLSFCRGYTVEYTYFDLYKREAECAHKDYIMALKSGCPFEIGDCVRLVDDAPYSRNSTKGHYYVQAIDTDGTVNITRRKGRNYGAWAQWTHLEKCDSDFKVKVVEEDKTVVCDFCGCVIEIGDEYCEFDGKVFCHDCEAEHLVECEDCGEKVWAEDINEVDGNLWCEWCFEENTAECDCCGERYLREDMTHTGNGDCVCEDCLSDNYFLCCQCDEWYPNDDARYDRYEDAYCEYCWDDRNRGAIEEYWYKPTPIFYGDSPDNMYMGVEIEMDGGGEDGDNAQELLDIANDSAEHIYIKHDGSLDEGFEIVSHPATLEYHCENIQWQRLMTKALSMEYRSHDTSTCGLHCHISRASLGDTYEEKENTISKIIYFTELHWAEILKFSRRTEYAMSRWAARYGIESDCKKTYEKAKGNGNRYHCINLENEHTIEFRMFRGTLRYNTFIATLQFVWEIWKTCVTLSDKEVETQTWNDFVMGINKDEKPELITYLKERNLYVNDSVECNEEEM